MQMRLLTTALAVQASGAARWNFPSTSFWLQELLRAEGAVKEVAQLVLSRDLELGDAAVHALFLMARGAEHSLHCSESGVPAWQLSHALLEISVAGRLQVSAGCLSNALPWMHEQVHTSEGARSYQGLPASGGDKDSECAMLATQHAQALLSMKQLVG